MPKMSAKPSHFKCAKANAIDKLLDLLMAGFEKHENTALSRCGITPSLIGPVPKKEMYEGSLAPLNKMFYNLAKLAMYGGCTKLFTLGHTNTMLEVMRMTSHCRNMGQNGFCCLAAFGVDKVAVVDKLRQDITSHVLDRDRVLPEQLSEESKKGLGSPIKM